MNTRWLLQAALALAALLYGTGAWAQECELRDAIGIDFGEYNPLANQVQDSTGEVRIYCNNPTNMPLDVVTCLGLRAGSAGDSIDQRWMKSAEGELLGYQIYTDPARTVIWREISTGAHFKGTRRIPAMTNGMVIVSEVRLYGRILSGQQGAIPGGYDSFYTFPAQIEFAYGFVPASTPFIECEALSSNPGASVQSFAVTASVPHKCEITVGPTNLDFGAVTGLEVPARTRRFRMRVRCSMGTHYRIALDDGQFPDGPGRRRMRGPAGFIDYDIFQNFGLTTRWGMTSGGATGQIMAPLTGTGANQNHIGFGHVPAQTAPGVGTYQDTVIVTVAY